MLTDNGGGGGINFSNPLTGVELIEQPVKAGEDWRLDGVASPIPLGADESVQDRADLK